MFKGSYLAFLFWMVSIFASPCNAQTQNTALVYNPFGQGLPGSQGACGYVRNDQREGGRGARDDRDYRGRSDRDRDDRDYRDRDDDRRDRRRPDRGNAKARRELNEEIRKLNDKISDKINRLKDKSDEVEYFATTKSAGSATVIHRDVVGTKKGYCNRNGKGSEEVPAELPESEIKVGMVKGWSTVCAKPVLPADAPKGAECKKSDSDSNDKNLVDCKYEFSEAALCSLIGKKDIQKCEKNLSDSLKLQRDIDRLQTQRARLKKEVELLNGEDSDDDSDDERIAHDEDCDILDDVECLDELEERDRDRRRARRDRRDTEATHCIDCGLSKGRAAVNIVQTGVWGIVQIFGIHKEASVRKDVADIYADQGHPPPPNLYSPYVVGSYGLPFNQAGIYGATYGGNNGSFGCSNTSSGGGYQSGPYGSNAPWGQSNPYGQRAGRWANPNAQVGQWPNTIYQPGIFPGGQVAGPWGVNQGQNGIFAYGQDPNGQFYNSQYQNGQYQNGQYNPNYSGQFGVCGGYSQFQNDAYSQYNRALCSRVQDNYNSTAKELWDLNNQVLPFRQRIDFLQYQLMNPYTMMPVTNTPPAANVTPPTGR